MNLEAAKVMKPRKFRTRRLALHAFGMRRGTGTPTVPSGSGWQRVGGCFLTRRHGGAEKHAENMFGLASVLGTQRRKVKTGERGVSGDPTASQRGSRWGGRLPMRRGTAVRNRPDITGRRLFRPGRDCIEWGGCFLTRRHGGAEKHAENMFGLASVLGTQRRKVKT